MKKLVGLMLLLLVGVAVTPQFLSMEGGRVRLKAPALAVPDLPELPAMPSLLPSGGGESAGGVGGGEGAVRIYKWRDESGQLHFSNQPPPSSVAAQSVTVDTRTNVVPAVRPVPEVEAPPGGRVQAPAQVELPASPYDVQGMVDAAKQAGRQLEERMEEQKRVLDQL